MRVALLVVLLAAFALRVYGLALQDIWWDEARNLDVALRPFGQIATASELDIHPPVYFWLLHGWLGLAGMSMGDAPLQMAFVGRFLSLCAGVIAVALLFAWGRRLDREQAAHRTIHHTAHRTETLAHYRTALPLVGLCAALVGALSPFWLAESQETRMYTVGFALLAAAGLVLLRALPVGSVVHLLPYIVLGAAALLVHYNVAFILAAWHLWWLIWAWTQPRRRVRMLESIGAGAAILLLVSPILPIALRQIPTYANPNLIVPSVWTYLSANWRAYFGGYAVEGAEMAQWADLWLIFVALICAAGVLIFYLRGRRAGWHRGHTATSFLLVWVAGGLLLYYIAVMDRGAFNVRYAAFVTPALYLLVGLAMTAIAAGRRLTLVLATTVVAGGLFMASVADFTDEEYFREDVTGVVDWLAAESGANDVILVDQRYPFGFYWPGFADHPDEQPQPVAGMAAARYLFVDINTLDQRLSEYLDGAERVFWVQWFESDTDPRRAVNFLLDQVGERGESRHFRGFSIASWQLSQQAEFSLAEEWQPIAVTFDSAAQTVEMSAPTLLDAQTLQVPVVLRWRQAAAVAPGRWKARVALYDAEGARLAQSDERLLNDRHLFPSEWQPEDAPLNVYMLRLDTPLDPGIYELRLLVYDEDEPDRIAWPHLVDGIEVYDGIELVLTSLEIVEE